MTCFLIVLYTLFFFAVSVSPSFVSIIKGTWEDDIEMDLKEIESGG